MCSGMRLNMVLLSVGESRRNVRRSPSVEEGSLTKPSSQFTASIDQNCSKNAHPGGLIRPPGDHGERAIWVAQPARVANVFKVEPRFLGIAELPSKRHAHTLPVSLTQKTSRDPGVPRGVVFYV